MFSKLSKSVSKQPLVTHRGSSWHPLLTSNSPTFTELIFARVFTRKIIELKYNSDTKNKWFTTENKNKFRYMSPHRSSKTQCQQTLFCIPVPRELWDRLCRHWEMFTDIYFATVNYLFAFSGSSNQITSFMNTLLT